MNPLTGCPCRRRRSEELHSAPELAGGTIQSGMMRAMLLRSKQPKVTFMRWFTTSRRARLKEKSMVWNTPTLVEICIGLEINGYLPAEF